MTNAELIQKIRNEIERQRKFIEGMFIEGDNNFYDGQDDAYNNVLSFLSTLESEKPEPYNPIYDEAYLNEKIKKATESWRGVDVDAMLAECRGYDEEKSEKPSEGLEEEIHKYNKERFDEYFPEQDGDFISEVDFMTCLDRVARHFAQWGAEHARKQMLKEAVEAEIYGYDDGSFELIASWLDMPNNSIYKDCDKVRIIIVKE